MQLPLQLGVTDKQTDSRTTVTLCACALRVDKWAWLKDVIASMVVSML